MKFAKIQYDDPSNLLVIRWIYGVSQGVLFALCAYIYHAIAQRGDEKKSVKVVATPAFNAPPDQAPMESILTYKEYDLAELVKLTKNFALGAAVTVVIHYYMAVVPALVLQIVTQPITLFEHPLFSIYILDKDAGKHESLKRPFADLASTPTFKALQKSKQTEPQPPTLGQSDSEIPAGERTENKSTGGNAQTSLSTAEKRPTRSSFTPQEEE